MCIHIRIHTYMRICIYMYEYVQHLHVEFRSHYEARNNTTTATDMHTDACTLTNTYAYTYT